MKMNVNLRVNSQDTKKERVSRKKYGNKCSLLSNNAARYTSVNQWKQKPSNVYMYVVLLFGVGVCKEEASEN